MIARLYLWAKRTAAQVNGGVVIIAIVSFNLGACIVTGPSTADNKADARKNRQVRDTFYHVDNMESLPVVLIRGTRSAKTVFDVDWFYFQRLVFVYMCVGDRGWADLLGDERLQCTLHLVDLIVCNNENVEENVANVMWLLGFVSRQASITSCYRPAIILLVRRVTCCDEIGKNLLNAFAKSFQACSNLRSFSCVMGLYLQRDVIVEQFNRFTKLMLSCNSCPRTPFRTFKPKQNIAYNRKKRVYDLKSFMDVMDSFLHLNLNSIPLHFEPGFEMKLSLFAGEGLIHCLTEMKQSDL